VRDAPPPRGIVRSPRIEHRRVLPAERLADHVAHYWWVRWELGDEVERAETLGHPTLHLVFEDHEPPELVGVMRSRFERVLRGSGSVFGVKLRPACCVFVADASELRDRRAPLPAALDSLADLRPDSLAACVRRVEEVFDPPPLGDRRRALRDLVERIAVDPTLTRVEQLAATLGASARTLERRFLRDVGATPKWVLRRYRVIEAIERLREGEVSLASLAAELGYADQAHFTRDFRTLVGQTPGELKRSVRDPGDRA